MFGRKKKNAAADEATEPATTETQAAATAGDASGSADPVDGPCDISRAGDTGRHVDLGSVLLVPSPTTELRLEVDQKTQEVNALQVADDDGGVQVQVFAAPRSSGIWEDIRDEIAESVTANGGTVDRSTGPFGSELHTRLAQPGPQGRTVFAPAIFAGVEGPRWFLRAVYSGSAAVDPAVRERYDEVLRTVVVVRGDEPRAPREMLPLQMPKAPAAQEQAESDDAGDVDDFKPFERGPEITEVR